MIEQNRLSHTNDDEGVAYHFNDQNKVKTIYLDNEFRDKIIAGKLAIVRLEKRYEVVGVEIAERIKARDADAVVVLFATDAEQKLDDEYADYKIPDDLIW